MLLDFTGTNRLPPLIHLLPYALGLLLLSGASEAAAQGQQPPPPESYAEPVAMPVEAVAAENTRDGFLLGASFGFGTLDAGNNSGGTVNYHVEFGGFLHPKWAVAVGLWGGDDSDDFSSVTNHNAGLIGQYWMRDSIWFKGYLGTARLTEEYDGIRYANYEGMAFGGMAGWDFYNRGSYHVHGSLGLTFGGYKDVEANSTAMAIQVGLQYY